MPPSKALFEAVRGLYERGLVIDALKMAQEHAPLEHWGGAGESMLASRIAFNAGGPRIAYRLVVRQWRADSLNPAVQYEYGLHLSSHRGPLALWSLFREWNLDAIPDPGMKANLLSLKAGMARELRDFSMAEALLDEASTLDPQSPWLVLQRSYLMQSMDRIEEALAIAKEACALHPHPFYRPGTQFVAHLFRSLGRTEEALVLLRDADKALQSGPVAAQLYGLLADQCLWSDAEQALERHAALSPLMESRGSKWVAAQKSLLAYKQGRRAEAATLADGIKDAFHRHFSEKLTRQAGENESVLLPVPFVQQHYKTCAPATLASLGRYWNMPAGHLQVVEAICYDGTPHWKQREWARKNGWLAREFRVTWEGAVDLLSRGIPFAVSTVEASSAHMQAVIGYDRVRGTLIIRDPGRPGSVEYFHEDFFKRYRAFGPHGMILLPEAKGGRLQADTLEGVEIYDARHTLSCALAEHDRETARGMLELLETRWPDDSETCHARLELAFYDANAVEIQRCLDALIAMFPDTPALALRKLSSMRDSSHEEKIAFLSRCCSAPGSDPALWVAHASELSNDARKHAGAWWWLRKAMKSLHVHPGGIRTMADLKWAECAYEEATELYRLAATTEELYEGYFETWFLACVRTRQTEAALGFLEARFRRLGRKSARPAITLAWALREIERPEKAREVLSEASLLLPTDGDLLLHAASLDALLGETDKAADRLGQARGKARQNDWLRTAVEIAEARFDSGAALGHARALLELEPLATDGHRNAARLLTQIHGHAAAVEHLKNTCAQYRHHCGLRRLLIEWLEESGPEAVAQACAEYLQINATDAWARREYAGALSELNRLDEALANAEEALRMEPARAFNHSCAGYVEEQLRHFDRAHGHYRQAIRLSVDTTRAMRGLLRIAATDVRRREELEFIQGELMRQVVSGDGLLAFLDLAKSLIEPEAMLALLRQAHSERPDLWHSWSCLVSFLDDLGRSQEALELAEKAAARFPHLPRLWLDLSTIHRRLGQPEREIEAAQRACDLNPAWTQSASMLANALERRQLLNEAKSVYERALRHQPRDAQMHFQLGSVCWRLHDPEKALACAEHALRLCASYEYAWDTIRGWALECGQLERVLRFARELANCRTGDAQCWLMLAKILSGPERFQERLEAADRALSIDPKLMDGWDFKAELLAEAERFEDALEACESGARRCSADLHVLKGRRAWILACWRKVPEAIAEMKAVLAENGHYAWGWAKLVQWQIEQKLFDEAELSVGRLLRLLPNDPWGKRQLAMVRLHRDDKPGAEQVFKEILKEDPTDAWAASSLFEIQKKNQDFAAARSTLDCMRVHQPGASTMAHEIVYHLAQNDISTAAELFRSLCLQPDPDSDPLEMAVAAFKKSSARRLCVRILKKSLKSAQCSQHAGALAIQWLLEEHRFFRAIALFESIKNKETKERAAFDIVAAAARARHSIWLRLLIRHNRELFYHNDWVWGQVGYAYANFKRMHDVVDWMRDWKTRASVEPWMLYNFCFALRHLGRYPASDEIARHAVQKWGYRLDESDDVRILLAVESALAGNVGEAEEYLRTCHKRNGVSYDEQLCTIAKAAVEYLKLAPEQRRSGFGRIGGLLDAHLNAANLAGASKDVRNTYRRASRMMIGLGAGPYARLWFSWKLNWQWCLAGAVIPVAFLYSQGLPALAAGVFIAGLRALANKSSR